MRQIEVEQQFLITSDQRNELLKDAQFLKGYTLHDAYYDTVDFELLKKDFWLRTRNGTWELKMPFGNQEGVQKYLEVINDAEICDNMPFAVKNSLRESVQESVLLAWCSLEIQRESYTLAGVRLDFDMTRFSDGFEYHVLELELLVSSESEVLEAQQRILEMSQRYKLEKNADDKVSAFMKARRPDLYVLM